MSRHAFERVPDHLRGQREFVRSAEPGRWRENLSAEEQAAIERVLAEKLRELGYEA